jgi:hypothetical protein
MTPKPSLTKAEAAAIKPTLDELSSIAHYPITLAGLFNRWVVLVGAVERGYDDCLDEYMNDLASRDLLAKIIDSAPHEASEKIARWLVPWDDRFFASTRAVAKPLRASPHSWWNRLPNLARGEFKQDLATWGYDTH